MIKTVLTIVKKTMSKSMRESKAAAIAKESEPNRRNLPFNLTSGEFDFIDFIENKMNVKRNRRIRFAAKIFPNVPNVTSRASFKFPIKLGSIKINTKYTISIMIFIIATRIIIGFLFFSLTSSRSTIAIMSATAIEAAKIPRIKKYTSG